MREYTRLALLGETAEAAQVAATLDPVRAVAAKWLSGWPRQIDTVAAIKAWAGAVGMSGGPVRPPLVSLTPAQRAELAADLAGAGLLAA
jgi:4-hydroxy-tetrahydrodipicolinate synthase